MIANVTKEECLQWLEHPITQRLRAWAREGREDFKERWARAEFTAPSNEECMLLQSKALGACEVLDRLINIHFEEFYEPDEPSDESRLPTGTKFAIQLSPPRAPGPGGPRELE